MVGGYVNREADTRQDIDRYSTAPPAPPERKSSYGAYKSDSNTTSFLGGLPFDPESLATFELRQQQAKKSVTFHANVAPQPVSNDNDPQQYNNNGSSFVQKSQFAGTPLRLGMPASVQLSDGRTPENSLFQSQMSTPGTPATPGGVVGAQELYRDPRDRIAAARAVNNGLTIAPTPDRMSFRDKMRHFASEAGEDTPQEKAKISRAQQRLEAEMFGAK